MEPIRLELPSDPAHDSAAAAKAGPQKSVGFCSPSAGSPSNVRECDAPLLPDEQNSHIFDFVSQCTELNANGTCVNNLLKVEPMGETKRTLNFGHHDADACSTAQPAASPAASSPQFTSPVKRSSRPASSGNGAYRPEDSPALSFQASPPLPVKIQSKLNQQSAGQRSTASQDGVDYENAEILVAPPPGYDAEKSKGVKADLIVSLEVLKAAFVGDVDSLRFYLEKGAPVNYADKVGRTALHYAAAGGKLEALELLLVKGADMNRPDIKHWTPLLIAVCKNYLECVRMLLKYGASIDVLLAHSCAPCRGGSTQSYPIHFAAIKGSIPVSQLLLQHGQGVDTLDKAGRTALHYGAFREHKGYLLWLLIQKAQVDVTDELGRTPLHVAALSGHLSNVQLLVEHHAPLNRVDRFDLTPLRLAEVCGHHEVAAFLKSELTRQSEPYLYPTSRITVIPAASRRTASQPPVGRGRPANRQLPPQEATGPRVLYQPMGQYADLEVPTAENKYVLRSLTDEEQQALVDLAVGLQEEKVGQLERAVRRLGIEVCKSLFEETKAIQRNGGQTTADGLRKRTPGGVFFTLLKSRCEAGMVKKEDWDYVRTEEKEALAAQCIKSRRDKKKQALRHVGGSDRQQQNKPQRQQQPNARGPQQPRQQRGPKNAPRGRGPAHRAMSQPPFPGAYMGPGPMMHMPMGPGPYGYPPMGPGPMMGPMGPMPGPYGYPGPMMAGPMGPPMPAYPMAPHHAPMPAPQRVAPGPAMPSQSAHMPLMATPTLGPQQEPDLSAKGKTEEQLDLASLAANPTIQALFHSQPTIFAPEVYQALLKASQAAAAPAPAQEAPARPVSGKRPAAQQGSKQQTAREVAPAPQQQQKTVTKFVPKNRVNKA